MVKVVKCIRDSGVDNEMYEHHDHDYVVYVFMIMPKRLPTVLHQWQCLLCNSVELGNLLSKGGNLLILHLVIYICLLNLCSFGINFQASHFLIKCANMSKLGMHNSHVILILKFLLQIFILLFVFKFCGLNLWTTHQ